MRDSSPSSAGLSEVRTAWPRALDEAVVQYRGWLDVIAEPAPVCEDTGEDAPDHRFRDVRHLR